MDCKKPLTTVSLSIRLGSVEVEYSLLGQSIQEPSQQVNNTVIGVQPNQYSKSRLVALTTQWLPGCLQQDNYQNLIVVI